MNSKTISVLGASGSVGLQALDVARKRGIKVSYITANTDVKQIEALAREFNVKAVAMACESSALDLRRSLADTDIRVHVGKEGILEGISEAKCDAFVNSISGMAGLLPSLEVIKTKKRLCLANKESLVIAGELVMKSASDNGCEIIPVDSEHSAIFQSLKSGRQSEISRIILTASGGPSFGKTKDELERVSVSDTLSHPTWSMGKKITVDSATLMNKGFELIEAAHLFGVSPDKIEVVVHPESILHSAVEYIDNTVIGELSLPDMRACVQYALDYPERSIATIERLDLFKIGSLSFKEPDFDSFPLLSLAKRAAILGTGMGAVLNAADEVAVEAFLKGRLSFNGISEVVTGTFEKMTDAKGASSLSELLEIDTLARKISNSLIEE